MADVPNTLTLRLCDTAALRRRFKGEKRRLAISRGSRRRYSRLRFVESLTHAGVGETRASTSRNMSTRCLMSRIDSAAI